MPVFDWTINVGNVFTLIGLIGGLLLVISRHLKALSEVRAGLDANVDTLSKMADTLSAVQRDLHEMDKRLAVLEAITGKRLHNG